MAKHMCMMNNTLSRPCLGFHIGYQCNGGIRVMSKHHPTQGPYRIQMQCWDDTGARLDMDMKYPVWDSMVVPILRRGYDPYDRHIVHISTQSQFLPTCCCPTCSACSLCTAKAWDLHQDSTSRHMCHIIPLLCEDTSHRHLHPIKNLAWMVLAHCHHPSIAFVPDMDLGWDGACKWH